MIGLIDCNNFYVSCDRAYHPPHEREPLGVHANHEDCEIARSHELQARGVAMGTPAFELQPLLRQRRIALRSSNYELYGDLSSRVQLVLE